jgi:hypothetical protein
VTSGQCVRFDPYLTPIAYRKEQHRRHLTALLLVMDFLIQQQAPVAYIMPIANWRYFSLSVDPCWGGWSSGFRC